MKDKEQKIELDNKDNEEVEEEKIKSIILSVQKENNNETEESKPIKKKARINFQSRTNNKLKSDFNFCDAI